MSNVPSALARRYVVEDLPGASVPCTRIQNILCSCSMGKPLSINSEEFLRSRGLMALIAFAKGEVDEGSFKSSALIEQQLRRIEAKERSLLHARQSAAAVTEIEVRQQAMWAVHERYPRTIAKRRNRELRQKFGVDGYVDEDAFPRLMSILKCLDRARRLSEEDVEWLAGIGRDLRTGEIMRAYHRLEADYYLQELKQTGNVWCAVSASSHLRKCDASTEAHDLLSSISNDRLTHAKLKSAIFTTHGGALRDLNRQAEAKHLAEEAHSLLQADYRPCTLLGAIHIELGEISLGHEWYRKAEARGAPTKDVDRELRMILLRLPQARRSAIVNELIATDSSRYDWMRTAFSV